MSGLWDEDSVQIIGTVVGNLPLAFLEPKPGTRPQECPR